MWWKTKLFIFVCLELSWILHRCHGEKDFNTCSFYYWKMDWHSAVKTCSRDNKHLLCYKSKKEIEDITEAFRLAAFGDAELELWLSSKNCSQPEKTEACLSLHITKSEQRVWHFFQEDCSEHLPFVCCVKEQITADYSTENSILTDFDFKGSYPITSSTASSLQSNICRSERRRGISWPNTPIGKIAIHPCPGKSIGSALWSCEDKNNALWNDAGPDMRKCRSTVIMNLWKNFNTSSIVDSITQLESLFQDDSQDIFAEDLVDVMSMMTYLPERLFEVTRTQNGSTRWYFTKDMIGKSTSIFDRMVTFGKSWHDLSEERRIITGSSLLSTVDKLGMLLGDTMTRDVEEVTLIFKNMALEVMKTKTGLQPKMTASSHYSQYGSIALETEYNEVFNLVKEGSIVVFVFYTNLTSMLSRQEGYNLNSNVGSSLNSPVVSATVSQNRAEVLVKSKVKIVVEHLVPSPNATACVFWNMQRHDWDTEGCRLEESSENFSTCVCDHLTNFAVLMDYRGVMDRVEQLPFHYITVIGCTLSIIGLIICVSVFTCYSYQSKLSWGLRYTIHRNLCLTLLIANLVLVLGMDKADNQKLCAIVAGLLHYFFLSAFSWMLLEGVHIYLLLVVVFASRRSHWEKYYLFGYGFPIVIVAVTAISRPTYYGTDEVCWLSAEKGTIWAFMGPVAFILMLNCAALFLAQWKASHISIKDDNVAMIKRWLRVTIILFPVLGITWVFGFLYVGKHFQIAGYLFALLNSLQGFCIFVCHCLMDKKARSLMIASFSKKTSSVNTGSSNLGKRHKNTRESISEKENGCVENGKKQEMPEESQPISFKEKWRKNWENWHRPWSFCFDMPISERISQDLQKEHRENPPKPFIVQWNNLNDKTNAC